jgi:hypothetical protein
MSIDKLGSFLEACARGTEAVSAERMKDLYRGVMLGVATGNALGIPVEGRSSAEIRGDFAGGIREVDAREKTMP